MARSVRQARAALRAIARAMATGDDTLVARACDGVDWETLLALAEEHRLVGVAGAVLERSGVWARPTGVARERWQAARRASAASALVAAGELSQIFAMFREAGVHAMAYKGPALALEAYGDLGLRSCTDLDVVVAPAQFARARSTLLGGGYVPRQGMGLVQEAVVFAGQGHAEYALPNRPSPFVELHWRFAAQRLPWSPGVEEVLARARHVTVAGNDVAIPCDDDQVLLLALHGTRHAWSQLEWMVALGVFLRRPIDAMAVLGRAERIGAVRALLVGVSTVAAVLDVAIPEPFAAAAERDARVAQTVHAIAAPWVDGADGASHVRFNERRLLERARDVARYHAARLLLPTKREWEWVRLPAVLTPCYVPLRLVRLAVRGSARGEDE